MNCLFQEGATIGWLWSESVVLNHARRSVVPERLADSLLGREAGVMTDADYFTLTHLDDALMTDQEIRELPKVWVIGGDGALGDIGFQNVSKVILQNRPNVKMLMLHTPVSWNTAGPPFSRLTRPASRSTGCRTICPRTRPNWCAIRAACPSSYLTRATVRRRRRRSISRAIRHRIVIGGARSTNPRARNTATRWPTGR